MYREQFESLAAVGLLLLGCTCCWLLIAGASCLEARSAARLGQLQRLATVRAATTGMCATGRVVEGQLAEFDGLFGDRTVHRVQTRFGEMLAVAAADPLP